MITETGGITKIGSNIEDLSGVNSYTGATNVNDGFLRLAPGGSILGSTAINVSNATLVVNDANAVSAAAAVTLTNGNFKTNASQQIGSLNGDATSTIAFSGAAPALWPLAPRR